MRSILLLGYMIITTIIVHTLLHLVLALHAYENSLPIQNASLLQRTCF